MRYKMEQYQDGKQHTFTADISLFSKYVDYSTGEKKQTILFTNVTGENGRIITDHVWVTKNKRMDKYKLKKGTTYQFMAKVGKYKRGNTCSDFQLKDICQIVAIA